MAIRQLGKKRDLLNVSILLLIALCVGIHLIATAAIVAKDGATFIKYAKQLEIAPAKTIIEQDQHPGYPWLILTTHKMMYSLREDISVLRWVYCAQSVTLIFRLLSIIVLYLIGKHLLGAKFGFWGVLILILLPKPAEYGSDALSDWPHLFFFGAGLLLLFKGAIHQRWWLFGFAGLAAGAGYLIRPECAQLVILGSLWLGLQLIRPEHTIGKGRALSALILLFVGFVAITGPYMHLKGAIFPKKNIGQFAQSWQLPEVPFENKLMFSEVTHMPLSTPKNIAEAFYKLVQNIGETLMWFFIPVLLVGMYKWLKRQKWHELETFLVITLVILNISVMIWLYNEYGYMSDRHTLPLLIIPILFVPVGLQELAAWFQEKFSKKTKSSAAIKRGEQLWFLVLFLIGTCICAPKLFRPIRAEKQGYRAAAIWLKDNTASTDSMAVPDERISFYAERKAVIYEEENIPVNTNYFVTISKNQHYSSIIAKPLWQQVYEYIGKTKRETSVTVYRKL